MDERIDIVAQILCSHLDDYPWEKTSEQYRARYRFVAEMVLGALENPEDYEDYISKMPGIAFVVSPQSSGNLP